MATEQLKKIIEDVSARRVVLPQFQRDFVWQPSAVIKLLVSLFNGYPIGSLLLMENNDKYDYRLIDGVPDGEPIAATETLLVLDGQQRLTACYRAFVGADNVPRYPGRYYFRYKDYVESVTSDGDLDGSSLEDFFVFLKPSRALRELNTTAAEISKGLFPLDVVFGDPRGSNYSDWLNRYTFDVSGGDSALFTKFSRIASRFQSEYIEKVTSYQVNYEKITRNTKPDVICTVFETINTTGIKLTVFDLLVAKSFKNGIRLRDKLEEAVNQYENIRALDPNGTQIAAIHLPRILGLMHNNQCKKGDLLQLPVEAIEQNWDRAVNSLDRMLGIMRIDFGCIKPEFIPSIDIISPLAVIVGRVNFTRDRHFLRFSKLYWNLVFSSYLSGAPETKSARIVREWTQPGGYSDDEDATPEVMRVFGFSSEELDEATRSSVIYKGVMSLLIARGACDLGPARTQISNLQPQAVEDHHIYPQQFLRNYGIKGYSANSILNRTPLYAETNRIIGASAPQVYLANQQIVGPINLHDALDGHAIPHFVMERQFSQTAFAEFRSARRAVLIRLIESATGQTISAGELAQTIEGAGEDVADEVA